MTRSADPLVIFTPSGGAATSRAPRSSTRPVRWGSTSIRSAAGAASAAAAGYRSASGRSPKHGITSSAESLSPFGDVGGRLPCREGARIGPTPRLHGHGPCRLPDRRSAGEPRSTARSCARASMCGPSTSTPSCDSTTSRWSGQELASPSGDLIRLYEALEREWGLTGLESDLHVVRAPSRRLPKVTTR